MLNTLEKAAKDRDVLSDAQHHGTNFKIVKQMPKEPVLGEVIGQICSNTYYVHYKALVGQMASDLEHSTDVYAVAVVDDRGDILGIIELVDFMSKFSHRDQLTYKAVTEVMKPGKSYNVYENIFAVANELHDLLKQSTVRHFLLRTHDNHYAGIFSTKDLLIFLSMMTQYDIDLAQKLQHHIVKERMVADDGKYKILGTSMMAKGVGGDFYAIKKINEHEWLVIICDVSGKGIAASLITAIIGGMLSVYDLHTGVDKFIQNLNKYLYENFELEKFITGIFMVLNTQSDKVTYYDMGHSFIYILRNNAIIPSDTTNKNLPIGVNFDCYPKSKVLQLQKNDFLLALTDGILEQTNDRGKEYNVNRVADSIFKHRHQDLLSIREHILNDMVKFMNNYPQKDDMTMILMKYC